MPANTGRYYFSFPESAEPNATTLSSGKLLREVSSTSNRLGDLLLSYGQLVAVKKYGQSQRALGDFERGLAEIEHPVLKLSALALQSQLEFLRDVDMANAVDEANELIAGGNERYWADVVGGSTTNRGVVAPLARVEFTDKLPGHLVPGYIPVVRTIQEEEVVARAGIGQLYVAA